MVPGRWERRGAGVSDGDGKEREGEGEGARGVERGIGDKLVVPAG